MRMNFTPVARAVMRRAGKKADAWCGKEKEVQIKVLRSLLRRASATEVARRYGFDRLHTLSDEELLREFRRVVPLVEFEDIRKDVLRMINGERDVLWRGRCRNYAQSSGTSGGKSKYIPVTNDSLYKCHYSGAFNVVGFYLDTNPDSRMFAGKGFILGGSFSNTLDKLPEGVRVGDLSATLINNINGFANMFRVPDKRTALMSDWTEKLPALVEKSRNADITNLSGVPSWFMTVIKEVLKSTGKNTIAEVWPNLEVFFHGGIGFEPYREEYDRLIGKPDMRYYETYNASEGFFAAQRGRENDGMLLLVDNDVFFEFLPLGASADAETLTVGELEEGQVYEMIITSSNGLWRYRIGDTVRVAVKTPLKIRVAGRTKSYINAFGEELMEENAEKAIQEVCAELGCSVANYTAAPVFARKGKSGRHQWLVEWDEMPPDTDLFSDKLDKALRSLNSDYDAKRTGNIFLDKPEIISVKKDSFTHWLASHGSGKLGGQRKVPRLSNNREIVDSILSTQ